jgi:hypothetical protein
VRGTGYLTFRIDLAVIRAIVEEQLDQLDKTAARLLEEGDRASA